jgi:hypothetical protein
MKKKVALILIVLMLVSGSVWAGDTALGLEIAGGGVVLGVFGFFMAQEGGTFYVDPPIVGWGIMGLGIVCIATGLVVALWPDADAVATVENNKIFQHVVFDATADKITLGARFRR